MTTVTRPVRRETAACYRGRPLVVELHPGYLELREKGKRQAVTLDYHTALEVGYKLLARQSQIDIPAAGRRRNRGQNVKDILRGMLRERFPWLGTCGPADGADVVMELAAFYQALGRRA